MATSPSPCRKPLARQSPRLRHREQPVEFRQHLRCVEWGSIEDNGLGCQFGGGLIGAPSQTASSNITKFEAHGSEFTNNTRTEFNPDVTGPEFTDFGGLLVEGGRVALGGEANTASGNTVVVRLWDAKIPDNHAPNFHAFGARCTSSLCLSRMRFVGASQHSDLIAIVIRSARCRQIYPFGRLSITTFNRTGSTGACAVFTGTGNWSSTRPRQPTRS